MSDLIDRQAAIEDIKECAEAAHSNHEWDMEQGYINAIECLKELPSAESKIKCVAKVTLSQEQIQDAVDKAVEKMKAELEPCDFCKHKDDCGDMALYCPSERRTDE